MKKCVILIVLSISLSMALRAQTLTPEVQVVVDACVSMRAAIGAGNLPALRAASEELKKYDIAYFGNLRPQKGLPSLDGHFIFDAAFADSLIAGRDVYIFAQRYADRSRSKGKPRGAPVMMANFAVAAHSSAHFTFNSKGPQDIAVVTEPGGSVTLKMTDKKHNLRCNDSTDETEGRPVRQLVFNLPPKEVSTVQLEVINTSDEEISFVIIGN